MRKVQELGLGPSPLQAGEGSNPSFGPTFTTTGWFGKGSGESKGALTRVRESRKPLRILQGVACLAFLLGETLRAEPQEPSQAPALEREWQDFDFRLTPANGFQIRQADSAEPLLHLGGVFVTDFAQYDDRNSRDKGLRLDRAIVRVDGSYENLDWRVAPDLRGIDTRGGLDEGWISYTPTSLFRVTAGLMEIPLTIENTIPEEELSFVGYAFPSYLDGRTDAALRLDGEIEAGLFSYDLAATAGEGFTRLGERVSGTQLSARGVLYPLRAVDLSLHSLGYEIPLLSGLFFAASYAHTPDFEGPLEVANPFRNKLFEVSRFEASDSDFLHLGYGADLGPFRAVHEFVRGGYRNIEGPAGDETLDDQVTAWSLSLSWMVTGEAYDSRPFRLRDGNYRAAPKKPLFWFKERGLGALELAFRYSNGDIDRDFFDLLGFTDLTTSSQEFRTVSVVVNWYATANVRSSIQIVRTIADQFPQAFDSHGRDTSVFLRLQYSF